MPGRFTAHYRNRLTAGLDHVSDHVRVLDLRMEFRAELRFELCERQAAGLDSADERKAD